MLLGKLIRFVRVCVCVCVCVRTSLTGESGKLTFKSNSTSSNKITLTWHRYRPPDQHIHASFIIYYKEA